MRTKEQDTQYQKARRAKLAAKRLLDDPGYSVQQAVDDTHGTLRTKEQIGVAVGEVFDAFFPKEVTKVSKRAAAVVVVEDGRASVREFKGISGYHYLPGDDVIGKMTQKQRDILINKLPKTPRAR